MESISKLYCKCSNLITFGYTAVLNVPSMLQFKSFRSAFNDFVVRMLRKEDADGDSTQFVKPVDFLPAAFWINLFTASTSSQFRLKRIHSE
jgi:hypothetical protein